MAENSCKNGSKIIQLNELNIVLVIKIYYGKYLCKK